MIAAGHILAVLRAGKKIGASGQEKAVKPREAKESSFLSVVYDGGILKPLQTRNGISFIQNKYLSPLEDVIEMVQLYERATPQGTPYIVAKTGFFLAAVIMPYSVINDKFVYQLSELAQQCRRALEVQKMARPAADPVDETQCRINVDESTGEIIDFPGEKEEG